MSKRINVAAALSLCAGLAEAQQTWIVNVDPLGFDVEGMASDPNSGVVYGTTGDDELITIDPNNGTGTLVGGIGFSSVHGLAFDPLTGTLYGSAVDDKLLLTIDPLTGVGTSVGPFGSLPQGAMPAPSGLAFDASTGTLYGCDPSISRLISIDVSTGQVSPAGAFGLGFAPNLEGLAFDPVSGDLFGSSIWLFRIDQTTGSATQVGALSSPRPDGLCAEPNSNQLLGAVFSPSPSTAPRAVLRIDPTTAAEFLIEPPGEFTSLQDAIGAAAPGDELHILPGNYGFANISKPLRLAGSGSGVSPTLVSCRQLTVSNLLAGERLVVSNLNFEGASIDQCAGSVLFHDVEATGIPNFIETIFVQHSADVRMHRTRVHEGGPGFGQGVPGIVCEAGSRLELVECDVTGGPGFALSGGSFTGGSGFLALSGSESHIALSNVAGGYGGNNFDSGGSGVSAGAGSEVTLSGTPDKSLIRAGLGGIYGSNGISISASGAAVLRYSGVAAPNGISANATSVSPPDPTLELRGVNSVGATLEFSIYGPPGATVSLLLGSDPIVQPTPGVWVDQLVSPLDSVPLGTIPGGGVLAGSYIVPDQVFGPDLIAQAVIQIGPGTVARTNSASATACGPLLLDCNANGIPDQCDVAVLDCNANDIPDDCEAAAGGDLNGNGVLDECETTTTYCSAKANSDGCSPTLLPIGKPSLTSPGVFILITNGVIPQVNGQFFYGLNGPATVPFLGGVLCALPPLRRTIAQNSGGTPGLSCDGTLTFDFNAWIQAGNEPFAQDGLQVNGQFWYRDPNAASGVGLSKAVEFFVGP